jgi:tetratricopeptide (TPR) repeat protein
MANKSKNQENSSNPLPPKSAVTIVSPEINFDIGHSVSTHPYDLNMLGRANTQWQFGDWESLVALAKIDFHSHPNRAKLALLVASGFFQIGSKEEARTWVKKAREWGCDKELVYRVLISGVYNTLGRAALILDRQEKATKLMGKAITHGAPYEEVKLISNARVRHQMEYLEHRKLIFDANHQNRKGEFFFNDSDFVNATKCFLKATLLNPDSARYCQNLAEAIARLDYRKGTELGSQRLVSEVEQTGKWDVVVRLYRQALKLDAAAVKSHHETQQHMKIKFQTGQVANPVFIVGCGHSGTSIMLALLGSHPSFYPIQKESAIFLKPDDVVQKSMFGWDDACVKKNRARWIEKTPPHIFQISRFLSFRPESQFIILLRDGRDVVSSLKYRIGYEKFEDRLDRWIYDNLAGLEYWDHPQVTVIKYESLVESPVKELKSICRFLGENYYKNMLDYHKKEHLWYSDEITKPEKLKNNSDHKDLRNWQINQPLYDGRGRWEKEMSAEEKDMFKKSVAQRYLEQFGYVQDANW